MYCSIYKRDTKKIKCVINSRGKKVNTPTNSIVKESYWYEVDFIENKA